MANARERQRPDPASLRRFYQVFGQHYRRYRGDLIAAYSCMLLGIGVELLVPWPLAWMIDHVIQQRPLPAWLAPLAPWVAGNPKAALAAFAAAFVALKLVYALVSFFDRYLVAVVAEGLAADIRERVHAHLLQLSLLFHRRAAVGDLITRLTSDISEVRALLVTQPEVLLRSAATVLAFAGVMFWLNWRLALVAVSILPLLYAMTRFTELRVREAQQEKKRREGRLAQMVGENVRALALVQAYSAEGGERSLFDEENQSSLVAGLRAQQLSRRFKRAMDLLVACATAAILYLGGRSVLGTELSLGVFVVFYAYIRDLYGPLDTFAVNLLNLARSQVAGARLVELMESEAVVEERADAIPAPPLRGRIEFEKVRFAYRHGTDVLRDLCFAIEPGETVALLGSSGAGKSTLVSLLLRFFDPDEGRILIDGRDLREYRIDSLRAQISVITQEAIVLGRSVFENIAFGRAGATAEQVVEAARRAEAHDFIQQLEGGYEHRLREGGSDLSGGERQRIHMARAILRDAPIVILDEPVTGLDAEAESRVLAALDRLTEDKTTIVIAHRLSTIRSADRILVLEGGTIVEQGTHRELQAASTLYRELCEFERQRSTAA